MNDFTLEIPAAELKTLQEQITWYTRQLVSAQRYQKKMQGRNWVYKKFAHDRVQTALADLTAAQNAVRALI